MINHGASNWKASRINRNGRSSAGCGCAALVILAIIGFVIYYYFFA